MFEKRGIIRHHQFLPGRPELQHQTTRVLPRCSRYRKSRCEMAPEQDESCSRSGAARGHGCRRFNRRRKPRHDNRCSGQRVRQGRDWIGGRRKVTRSRFKSGRQPRHRPGALPRQSDGTGGSSPGRHGQRHCGSSRPSRAQCVAGHLERHTRKSRCRSFAPVMSSFWCFANRVQRPIRSPTA